MAIVACKQDKPKTDLAAAQQRDSLTQVIAQKDNEINDLMSTMNEIEEGFREINEAETDSAWPSRVRAAIASSEYARICSSYSRQ